LEAAPGFMLVVSYNPGYQNLLKGMKPSTRQRFVALRFDYPDEAAETAIVVQESGIEEAKARVLVKLANSLRNLKDHDLEEAASTRLVIYAAKLIKSGIAPLEACRITMAEPLTDDEATVRALTEVIYAIFGGEGA